MSVFANNHNLNSDTYKFRKTTINAFGLNRLKFGLKKLILIFCFNRFLFLFPILFYCNFFQVFHI